MDAWTNVGIPKQAPELPSIPKTPLKQDQIHGKLYMLLFDKLERGCRARYVRQPHMDVISSAPSIALPSQMNPLTVEKWST